MCSSFVPHLLVARFRACADRSARLAAPSSVHRHSKKLSKLGLQGTEYTFHAKLLPWLTLDLDAAYTRARFLQDDPATPGRRIPGAIEGVVGAGLSFDNLWGGWFGGAKIRYFGPRPLIEDNSVRSKASFPVSDRLGYTFEDGLIVRLDGFNLLNQEASQIRIATDFC